MKVVVGIHEPPGRSVRLVETSHQILEDPLDGLAHQTVVVDMTTRVDIIHGDIVGALLLLADAARVLTETESREAHAVGGQELPGRPVALFVAAAVIVDQAFVVDKLRLACREQFMRFVLGLADQQHVAQAARVHQVQGNTHVDVYGLRPGSVNLPQGHDHIVVDDLLRTLTVEPRTGHLGIVREIVLEPGDVILLDTFHAGDLVRGAFVDVYDRSFRDASAMLLVVVDELLKFLVDVCHVRYFKESTCARC